MANNNNTKPAVLRQSVIMPAMPESAKPRATAGVRYLEVDAEHDGQRLDNYLIKNIKGVPKSHLYQLLRKGEIRINKGRRQPTYRLQVGDIVRIPPLRQRQQRSRTLNPEDLRWIEDAVLYQDELLMVINKPSGLAVHGGSGISLGLIEGLRQLFPKARFLELVHRLDRDTSGCLLVARRRPALVALQDQIQNGAIDKRYLALVKGQWSGKARTIDAPLERIPKPNGERWVQVSEHGKASRSRLIPKQLFADASLVEIKLLTGRTHQARVHCQYSGHVIAGDKKYGDRAFNQDLETHGLHRLFLHAKSLTFKHPRSGETMTVEAPLPEELSETLKRLENER